MSKDIVYLNGDYLPLAEAKVSVLDRGFIFGDGVYEVIPVYDGTPFRMAEHFARLQRSLDAIRIPNPHTTAEWAKLTQALVSRNGGGDLAIYYQLTRGVAKRDHAFPSGLTPTVFMMASPLRVPSQEQITQGISLISMTDFRWLKCDIKSISLLGNCIAKQAAVEAGAGEVVLFRDGYLTEASSSNVFAVKNGIVLVPPKNYLILPGITYDVVIDLAREAGLTVAIREVHEMEVRSADELWITSSTKEVIAGTRLDERPVGAGTPGPAFKRVFQGYQEYKRRLQQRAA